MTVTSFGYLIMIACGLVVYYLIPKKAQWIILAVLSVAFYWFAGVKYTFAFLIFSAVDAYIAALLIERFTKENKRRAAAITLIIAIILTVIPWILTSGSDLWVSGIGYIHKIIPVIPVAKPLPVMAALGMAYYTSQVIAYMVDCYWQIIERQKNPLKLLLFISFFPQLTTGPISKYSDLRTIFEPHDFEYKNLCFGAQRILWGFFKKLVLADRLGIIIDAIWKNPAAYSGLWNWLALLLYPMLIYCDFSGCMDIVIGTAEVFGIHLSENFRNPFFSKTIREFWTRWHITLGKWAKDYVMYPILKSEGMVGFGKKIRGSLGKRAAKYITSAIASGMVWLVMGIWHGGFKHIIGISLYYWILVELGELFDPLWSKINERMHINTEKFSVRLFQMIRTYIIYAFGVVFFKAETLSDAFLFYKGLFVWDYAAYTPQSTDQIWILSKGSLLTTGITAGGLNVIAVGMILLLIVGILREKKEYARNWIADQGIVFRWIIWLALFMAVIICGAYGPQYDATMFLYQNF